MTLSVVAEIARGMLSTTLLLMAPLLGSALAVGLAISLFQAVTQINELTLTFVPKLLVLALVLVLLGPWMLATMVAYTTEIFEYLPSLVR